MFWLLTQTGHKRGWRGVAVTNDEDCVIEYPLNWMYLFFHPLSFELLTYSWGISFKFESLAWPDRKDNSISFWPRKRAM